APAALRGAGRYSPRPKAAHAHSPGKPARLSPRPPSPHPASEPHSLHTTAPTHSHNSPIRSAHEMLNSVHKTHGHTSQTEPSAQPAHISIISAETCSSTKRRTTARRPPLDTQSPRPRPLRRAPLRLGHTLPPLLPG